MRNEEFVPLLFPLNSSKILKLLPATRLSSQQPQAALKQEARRDSLKLGSRRLPLETRERSDH